MTIILIWMQKVKLMKKLSNNNSCHKAQEYTASGNLLSLKVLSW